MDDLEKQIGQYISIHALRKESDPRLNIISFLDPISIHALRKESDGMPHRHGHPHQISIHALRKESD